MHGKTSDNYDVVHNIDFNDDGTHFVNPHMANILDYSNVSMKQSWAQDEQNGNLITDAFYKNALNTNPDTGYGIYSAQNEVLDPNTGQYTLNDYIGGVTPEGSHIMNPVHAQQVDPNADKKVIPDTERVYINGEFALVNPIEKQMIQQGGEQGVDLVQILGSGKLNHRGDREYGWWSSAWDNTFGKDGIGGYVGDVWDETVGVGGLTGWVDDAISGEMDWSGTGWWDNTFGKDGLGGGVGDFWDETIGKGGLGGAIDRGWSWLTPAGHTGWFTHDKSDDWKTGAASKAAAQAAMGSSAAALQAQMDASLGGEGTIKRQRDLDVGAFETQAQEQFSGAMGAYNQALGGTNIAGAGSFNDLETNAMKTIMNDYGQIQDSSRLAEEQSELNLLTDIQREILGMKSDYRTATQTTYRGSDFDELQASLDAMLDV